MTPSYFGDADRQLLGLYHPPQGRQDREAGVVLCYPAAQEYMRTHWAFRKLATSLAQDGFHVLRFDYFGTGDSAGTSAEGSVAQWVGDVAAAVAELRDVAGVKKVSLVGLRLGAALAARASTARLKVRDLVLWEPVVHGAPYLQELEEIQRAKLARYLREPVIRDELLGFELPPALRTGIEQVDLLSDPPWVADRTVLVTSEDRPEYERLRQRLGASSPLDFRRVQESAVGAQLDAAMLGRQALEAIVAALAGRRP